MAPSAQDGAVQPGRLRRWLRIHPGEGRHVLRLGLVALCFGIFGAAYFTGGTAVFVATTEQERLAWLLPLLYVLSGLLAFAVRWGFSALLGRFGFWSLALLAVGGVIAVNLLFAEVWGGSGNARACSGSVRPCSSPSRPCWVSWTCCTGERWDRYSTGRSPKG